MRRPPRRRLSRSQALAEARARVRIPDPVTASSRAASRWSRLILNRLTSIGRLMADSQCRRFPLRSWSEAPLQPELRRHLAFRANTPAVDAAARKDLAAVQAQLADVQQKLSGVGAGGTISVASVTNQGTVLRQTFPYPIAIGYRALWIQPKIANSLPPGY